LPRNQQTNVAFQTSPLLGHPDELLPTGVIYFFGAAAQAVKSNKPDGPANDQKEEARRPNSHRQLRTSVNEKQDR
jgi:hypothetical protein